MTATSRSAVEHEAAPSTAETLVWRAWDISSEGVLWSPVNFGGDVPWLSGELTADCEAGLSHPVPDVDCGCGLRGVADLDAFRRATLVSADEWLPKVVGLAELSGRQAGRDRHGDPPGTLRGERCRVVGPLFLGAPFEAAAQAVAERYSVCVVVADVAQLEWMREGLQRDIATLTDKPGRLRRRIYRPAGSTENSDRGVDRLRRISRFAGTTSPNWDEVAPGLWMGGSSEVPTSSEFDAVVTLWKNAPDPVGITDTMRWAIIDRPWPPPKERDVDKVVDWTCARLAEGKRVLVRCQIGWNRSGLIVGRVLTRLGHTPTEAVQLIREARGSAALRNRTFVSMVLGVPVPRTFRWGVDGAAGILFRRYDTGPVRYLLLRRSARTLEPHTWGLPGGGLMPNEAAWHAATREAAEEIGPIPSYIAPSDVHSFREPDGWTYTTFVVDYALDAVRLNDEHDEARWVTAAEARALRLHPDLSRAWTGLTGEEVQTAAPERNTPPSPPPADPWQHAALLMRAGSSREEIVDALADNMMRTMIGRGPGR